jgi:hypothetical protein
MAPNPFIIMPSKIYFLGNLEIVTNSTDKNTFLTTIVIKLTLDNIIIKVKKSARAVPPSQNNNNKS